MSSARGLPDPNTMFLREGANLQRWQSPKSSRIACRVSCFWEGCQTWFAPHGKHWTRAWTLGWSPRTVFPEPGRAKGLTVGRRLCGPILLPNPRRNEDVPRCGFLIFQRRSSAKLQLVEDNFVVAPPGHRAHPQTKEDFRAEQLLDIQPGCASEIAQRQAAFT